MSTEPMTDEELAEIEARAEKATPGPWVWRPDGYSEAFEGAKCPHGSEWTGHGPTLEATDVLESDKYGNGKTYTYPRRVLDSYGYDAWGLEVVKADADFIAHSRTDTPRLLAEIRRLKALAGEGQ